MILADNSLEHNSRNCVFLLEVLLAFVDSGNTPDGNYVLTTFKIGPGRMSWHSLANHVGMGSASQKAVEDLFSSCLISLTVKGSKVFVMEVHIC